MKVARAVAITTLALSFCAAVARGDWRTFDTSSGLASNRVTSMFEDRTGNFWFGTWDAGVTRTDGVRWRTFTRDDGLASNLVRDIQDDRSGNLWFATDSGVTRWDGSVWRTFTTADGLGSNSAAALHEDRSGALWVATGGGAGRWNGLTWETFPVPCHSILEDRAGHLWFAGSDKLHEYDGVIWRVHLSPFPGSSIAALVENPSGGILVSFNGPAVYRLDGSAWAEHPVRRPSYSGTAGVIPAVLAMQTDGSGNLWFLWRSNGAFRYDGLGWRFFGTTGTMLYADRSGNVWIGGNSGVHRYDAEGNTAIELPESLCRPDAMLQDRSGHVWVVGCGVGRFEGYSWRTFTTSDGLASPTALLIAEDRSGNIWVAGRSHVSWFDGESWNVATPDGLDGLQSLYADRSGDVWVGDVRGLFRFDGTDWRAFTDPDSLLRAGVEAILQDRVGNWWFGHPGGVSRYDGTTWTNYPIDDPIWKMLEDRAGHLWFLGHRLVHRFADSLKTFTTSDGFPNAAPFDVLEDRTGRIWVTSNVGASWFDGTTWSTYTTSDGLGGEVVEDMIEDRVGDLWFGTSGGASRYVGASFTTFTSRVGNSPGMTPYLEDHAGSLWFGVRGGLVRIDPDRIPPRSVFLTSPLDVGPSRDVSASFVAAFGEAHGIRFSSRLDGGPWSEWAEVGTWSAPEITDGVHTLEVRARDGWGNVEPIPARVSFEVDATPPDPVLTAPFFGEPVRGIVEVRGTATDARFERYGVAVRPAGTPTWTPLIESASEVTDGLLATWDTSSLPDGSYEIRLAVADTLGLTASDLVTVRVDNHAPYDEQTAPARVHAATGGDIYTLNGEVRLYFPPHAFAGDAQVTIDPVPADSVPAVLPSGATRVLPGYEIGWRGSTLEKPTRLELSLAGVDPGALSGLAIQFSSDGTIWRQLGGTVDAGTQRISLAVSEPGRYALFAGGTEPAGEHTLSALSFTPRVFSPTGGFADREVGIAFTLGQASSVTVRVYNRAGWLVREVASGLAMNPGANLVRWDGRDGAGAVVADGLYLVTVEAPGQTQTKALAVVR